MKFDNITVYNFDGAIHGMRNPLESWEKSDTETGICSIEDFAAIARAHLSKWGRDYPTGQEQVSALLDIILYNDGENALYTSIGPKDMKLMQNLIQGGTEHRKFMRQIFVTVDITAPLYWWKEFDTYKVGTVANSTSTMHKLASEPITIDCFEIGDFNRDLKVYDRAPKSEDSTINDIWLNVISNCETLRQRYIQTGDKRYWKELIRLLPESWLQTRTVTMNYENIRSIVEQRKNHKLNEWSGQDDPLLPNFIKFAMQLPYAKDLLF